VPNAFFEKTLYLLHEVDRTSRAYFQGLIKLTVLDTLTLAAGLWLLGIPGPFALGLICAVLAWVPYVGSILGGLLVVLVAATDFPDTPGMAYWAIALFGLVRLLDDFVYMPLTVGKSLELHPLVTVLMIFVGGAVAGVSGLMLVLPVLGVVMVIGETIGVIVTDPRLMARHRYALGLRREYASSDLCAAVLRSPAGRRGFFHDAGGGLDVFSTRRAISPPPPRGSSSRRPWWERAMRSTMASPRPAPAALVRAASSRAKGRFMRSTSCGGMPGPVSRTSMLNSPAAASSASSTGDSLPA